ncbi:MAG: hypothetical protein RIT81_43970 [Deltaproteobacteria bacterium]
MSQSHYLPDDRSLEHLLRRAAADVTPQASGVASIRFTGAPTAPPKTSMPPAPASTPVPAKTPAPPEDEGDDAIFHGAHTFELRLSRFAEWLARVTDARGCFVADDAGLPLVTVGVPDDYAATLGPIAKMGDRLVKVVPSPRDGSFAFEVDDERFLHVVWTTVLETRVAAGVIVREPLSPLLRNQVRRRLGVALASRGTHS